MERAERRQIMGGKGKNNEKRNDVKRKNVFSFLNTKFECHILKQIIPSVLQCFYMPSQPFVLEVCVPLIKQIKKTK
jgi:hypothetical protein